MTVESYDLNAKHFASNQNQTSDTLRKFTLALLPKKSHIVDLGCGGGHDVAWLHQNGFEVMGVDASVGMLTEAKLHYPQLSSSFIHDSLPEIKHLLSQHVRVDGILCNDVLSHIPIENLYSSIQSFKKILNENGFLLLSFPLSSHTTRDKYNRLQVTINFGEIINLCDICGMQLVQRIHQQDEQNPAIKWTILVLQNSQKDKSSGLSTIQHILANDSKNTTYKYALIRALCRISRNKEYSVTWHTDYVLIPMRDLTIEWIKLYWPIVTNDTFISQGYNDHNKEENKPHTKQIIIRSKIQEIRETYNYAASDLPLLLNQIDEKPQQYQHIITAIANSIKDGPIYHAGGASNSRGFSIFEYDTSTNSVKIPVDIWLDINRFEHWIEDSIIVRWFNLTKSFKNQTSNSYSILNSLINIDIDERDTSFVRDLLKNSHNPVYCVWTGNIITEYDVDHVIPYAVWGNNDIWNLIPATPSINRQKRDFLPTQDILRRQKQLIIDYWNIYEQHHKQLFRTQIIRALGNHIFQHSNWYNFAFEAFINKVERVASTRGIRRWHP